MDEDEDGCVSFAEFLRLMTLRLRAVGGKRETREAFDAFDRNGDGLVSEDELRHVVETLQASQIVSPKTPFVCYLVCKQFHPFNDH